MIASFESRGLWRRVALLAMASVRQAPTISR